MNKKLIKILAAGGATLGAATAVPAILVSCSDNNGNDSNSNIKKFNKYINLYDPLPNFPTGLTAQQTGIVIGTMKQTNVHLDGSETSLTTPGRLMLTSKLDTVSGNNQIWLWLNGSTEISAGTYNGKFTCFIWTPVGPGVGPVADEFDIYITGTVA